MPTQVELLVCAAAGELRARPARLCRAADIWHRQPFAICWKTWKSMGIIRCWAWTQLTLEQDVLHIAGKTSNVVDIRLLNPHAPPNLVFVEVKFIFQATMIWRPAVWPTFSCAGTDKTDDEDMHKCDKKCANFKQYDNSNTRCVYGAYNEDSASRSSANKPTGQIV